VEGPRGVFSGQKKEKKTHLDRHFERHTYVKPHSQFCEVLRMGAMVLRFLLLVALMIPSYGDVNTCVSASRELRGRGTGNTLHPNDISCMQCEPTRSKEDCPFGCQDIINQFYSACSGVCLPDTYYFDPQYLMKGCWDEHADEILRTVERCGCNPAARGARLTLALMILFVVSLIFSFKF
jgi:hypothetical protein